MYNLYHKIAVASVCTALGFAFGANKEAKAATFILKPTSSFIIVDSNRDGVGDYSIDSLENLPVGVLGLERAKAFYEFNIANLSLTYDTVISQAIFQAKVNTVSGDNTSFQVNLLGYRGPVSSLEANFVAGGRLGSAQPQPAQLLSFDVTSFISGFKGNNHNNFAGFGIRTNSSHYSSSGNVTLNQDASLIITTVDVAEPVPEPTTILTAAIALGWGGWLKRKNSNRQN
jgi:hypothetical protein